MPRAQDLIEQVTRASRGVAVDELLELAAPFAEDVATELLPSLEEIFGNEKTANVIADRATETATHFVWPILWRGIHLPSVFLNEFKAVGRTAPSSYASSIHNHRYQFVTLILRGGYLHQTYLVDVDGQQAAVRPGPATQLRRGNLDTVWETTFHGVEQLLPGTLTLVIKGAQRTDFSLSVDRETGIVRRHVPPQNRINGLRASLAQARQE